MTGSKENITGGNKTCTQFNNLYGQQKLGSKRLITGQQTPAALLRALCGHLKSDGTVSLASADGSKISISLGRSLSSTKERLSSRRRTLQFF